MSQRRTVVVDADGRPIPGGWLAGAVHGDITIALSAPRRGSFKIAAADPKTVAIYGHPDPDDLGIEEPFREVQLWRGDRCLLYGPMITPNPHGEIIEVDCAGYTWPLTRRQIGPAARPNLLAIDPDNPLDRFDVAVAVDGFTTVAPWADADITQGVVPIAWNKTGIKIHCDVGDATPVNDNTNPLAWASVRLNAAAYAHTVTLSALCWIETWIRPNARASGIGLAVMPIGWTDLFTDAVDVRWSTIDDNFPHGSGGGPQRLSVSIDVGVEAEYEVLLILTGPRGDTWLWDLDLDWDGGLEFSGEDQGDILFKLFDHGTGNTGSPFPFAYHHPLWPHAGEDYGHSNLHIDVISPPVGVPRSRRYLFGQSQTLVAAVGEFATLDDGAEWRENPPAREVHVDHPRTGQFRGDCTLWALPAGSNIADWAWSFQGEQANDRVVIRSADSASRRWGTAIDAASFAGGLTLTEVLQASVDTPDDALDDQARLRLTNTRRPIAAACKAPASFLDRGLWVGDRVRVHWWNGSTIRLNTVLRITRLTITGDDWLELVLEPWPNGET